MKSYKWIFSGILIIALIFGATLEYFSLTPELMAQPQVKSHKLTFEKKNKKWKVVHKEDKNKVKVEAKRGEKVIWEAGESDMYFQFMDENLFGVYTMMIKAGESREMEIGPKAKSGSNYYAVFYATEKEFAEGNSPPQIIVE